MKRFSVLAVLILLLIISVGVFAQDDLTIAGAVEDNSDFSILFNALDATDLLDTLDDEDAEFTLFAPTDDAFEALFEELDTDEETLLADPEALSNILLYHVVEGTMLSDDFEDDSEIVTLNSASIAVTVNDDGEIILDEFATVTEADIEVLNGVIHVIDGVLMPADEAAGGGEACVVFTEDEGTVQVRVGPGENRTSIAFLPANVEFEVLGQALDNDGDVWFKLDKEEATPGRSNAEAWVDAELVETIGDCENVVDANAPGLVPITQAQPTAVPSGDGGGGEPAENPTAAAASLPTGGSWTIFWNETTNASCTGTGNVSIPTVEIFGSSGMTLRINVSITGSNSFSFGNVAMTHIGNNVYQGSITLEGLTGTIYIDTVTANEMTGRFITSFDTCSATVTFRANHN